MKTAPRILTLFSCILSMNCNRASQRTATTQRLNVAYGFDACTLNIERTTHSQVVVDSLVKTCDGQLTTLLQRAVTAPDDALFADAKWVSVPSSISETSDTPAPIPHFPCAVLCADAGNCDRCTRYLGSEGAGNCIEQCKGPQSSGIFQVVAPLPFLVLASNTMATIQVDDHDLKSESGIVGGEVIGSLCARCAFDLQFQGVVMLSGSTLQQAELKLYAGSGESQIVWTSDDEFLLFEPEVQLTLLNAGTPIVVASKNMPIVVAGRVDRTRNSLALSFSAAVEGHRVRVVSNHNLPIAVNPPTVRRCAAGVGVKVQLEDSSPAIHRWLQATKLSDDRYAVGQQIAEGYSTILDGSQAVWVTSTRNRFTSFTFVPSGREGTPPCK